MPTAPNTWKDAFTVNTTTPGTQTNASIAQLNDGSFVAAWIDEQTDTIRYQFLDILGEPVGNEQQLLATTPNADYTSLQAYDLPGNSFGIVYGIETGAGGYTVRQIHLSDQGAIFFSQPVIASVPTATLIDTTTVVFSDTSAMLFWINEDATGDMAVRGRPFNPQSGALGTPFDVATTTTNDYYNFSAIALDNGNFALSFVNDTGAEDRLQTRVVDNTGSPVGPSNFITNGGNAFGDTDMTALANGGFAVLYDLDEGATNPKIRANIYNAANGPLGSTNTVDGSDGAIASLPGGGYAMAYLDQTTQAVVVGVFSASGLPLGGSAGIATIDSASGASEVGLFEAADGRFIVTWTDAAGDVRAEIVDVRDDDASVGNSPVQVGRQVGSTFTTEDVAQVFAMDGDDIVTENTGSALTGRSVDLGNGTDQINVTSSFGNANTYDGGDGDDSIDFSALSGPDAGVTADLDAGTATSNTSSDQVTITSFESAAGTTGDDTILGTDGVNTIIGGDGNDTINGQDGDDRLFGGLGEDLILGNGGNDEISLDTGGGEARGGSGDDTLLGSGDVDTIIGGSGADDIRGEGGADILRGSSGADMITGGDGDDDIFGGAGGDTIDTGAGNDEVWAGADDDMVLGLDGDDTLYGSSGEDNMQGNQGADTLFGGTDADALFGGDGEDTLYGGAGADLVEGMNNDDEVRGQGGNDIITGGAGDDELYGGGGNDDLSGGDGNDVMFGGAGDDTLTGGDGNDSFRGQGGADTFLIRNSDGGTNTILDFDAQEGDQVSLSGFSFQTAQDAATSFSQVGNDVVFTNGNDTFTFENAALSDVQGAVTIARSANVEATPRSGPDGFDFSGLVAPADPDADDGILVAVAPDDGQPLVEINSPVSSDTDPFGDMIDLWVDDMADYS